MAQKNTARRENGMGSIYQRENGTWVGKIVSGTNMNGKPKSKYFSGKSEAEVKKKIREFNRAGAKIDTTKMSVSTYLQNWLVTYKKDTIKRSSYDAVERIIRNHIAPNLGHIHMSELKDDDIQGLFVKMKNAGYSYSTIKKAHDCLSDALRHATIKGDIIKNPMMSVKMLSRDAFEKKVIRFFSKEECTLITEEATRLYSTGAPVYVYGDAYILMLNTGLRMGEAIGLMKEDWNKENNTLHVQRNVQSVLKRDREGNRLQGKELIYNTTKTYSGDRVIPLNKSAKEALSRLCNAHPDSKHIICSSKGDIVPPERLERTFYYMLKNVGIEKTGTHSLRHTFASLLFESGADIKTVSELLGHASIQITMDTYIHLIKKTKTTAVEQLDNLF